MRYAVLLSRPELPEPAVLAKIWAEFRKLPLADAALHARNAWGIVAEQLEQADAAALAGRLTQAGLAAEPVIHDRLAHPAEPVAIRGLTGAAPAIAGVPLSTHAAPEPIPWDELWVI